jgi:outer membrane immunogenic protein
MKRNARQLAAYSSFYDCLTKKRLFLLTYFRVVPKPAKPMKKFTLTFAVLGAFCAWCYAGPEPLSGKEMVQPAPVPTSCFEGWYFGIHGGGILTEFDPQTSAFEATTGPRGNFNVDAFDASTRRNGDFTWEGGLHAGYNWQRGSWVFGLEVDIQGGDLERNDSALAFIDLPSDEDETDTDYTTEIRSTTKLDWYATGRVRIGHTLGDRIMVFATGGGAVGLTEVSESTQVIATTTEGGTTSSPLLFTSNRGIRGGWTGGAGFDFCLTNHWILNFTYLYVDLGDESASSSFFGTSPQGRTFDSTTRARADFQFHVFQGGLSFKF